LKRANLRRKWLRTTTEIVGFVKDWEIIADNLSKAGWSWGCVSAVDANRGAIWIVDAHRDDGGTARAFALARFAFSIQAATSSASFVRRRESQALVPRFYRYLPGP